MHTRMKLYKQCKKSNPKLLRLVHRAPAKSSGLDFSGVFIKRTAHREHETVQDAENTHLSTQSKMYLRSWSDNFSLSCRNWASSSKSGSSTDLDTNTFNTCTHKDTYTHNDVIAKDRLLAPTLLVSKTKHELSKDVFAYHTCKNCARTFYHCLTGFSS